VKLDARAVARCAALAVAGVSAGLPAGAFALDPAKSLSECGLETWGPRDGLTGAAIRSIIQSPDGYLWIGGFGGAARYDGARLTRVEIEPPLDISGLAVVPSGILVAPYHGDPVCVRSNLAIGCWSGEVSLPREDRTMAVDADSTGAVWLGTTTGLHRFVEGQPLVHVRDASLPAGVITAVHRDAEGRLWVGTPQGLYLRTAQGFVVQAGPDGPARGTVRAIAEGSAGVWVLMDQALIGIGGPLAGRTPLPPDLRVGPRSRVLEDRDGNVWIGSEVGLTRVQRAAEGTRLRTFTRADGLPDDDVTALHEDREGSLWVGTGSGGLAQFTDRTLATNAGPPSLREEPIESVCEDGAGVMWFGTRLGLTRWRDGIEHTFTTADGLPDRQVYATYPGRHGELWVGTAAGLLRWREGKPPERLLAGRIFSLYLDRRDTLWIGTNDGLFRLAGGRLDRIPPAQDFRPGQVRGIQEDDRGLLWITSVKGLARVEGGQLVQATELPGASNADRGVFRDRDGTLWFGAGTSLIRLRRGHFRSFTAADGLKRDWLFQVLVDDGGYLWIATSHSIVRISKTALEAAEQGRGEPAPSMSFASSDQRREVAARRSRTPGAWKSADGRLWFATLRGVITIDPRRARPNRAVPPVVIESALVDGRPASQGVDNSFAPGPGNLEFHFAGVTLLEPQKAMHRYRLEGFDDAWVEAGTRRMAHYTNIPPGRYRFRVQARNGDGVWNEVGATVSLRLQPHVYQTAWFRALCGLALAGLGFFLYRTRLARLRGQYLAVFAERARVARELHDSLLQGMSAVALELRNVRAELPPSAATPSRRLQRAEDALSASLEETRRFVWNLREQPDGAGALGLALTRLADRVAEERGVPCRASVEGPAFHLSHDLSGGLFRVAQEALVNAAKHAGARTIELRLCYQTGAVRLTVSDDGKGFDPDQAPGASAGRFGLLGMRERAQRLGAALVVDSAPGRGTRIDMTVSTTVSTTDSAHD
jgi:ligand-binding sensor domain-containing protein/signal transduction histidine kinase